MAFDPGFGTFDIRLVRRAIGAASLLLALSLLADCGSRESTPPVVTGSTTTCVPMGSTISCSCTPVTATHGS